MLPLLDVATIYPEGLNAECMGLSTTPESAYLYFSAGISLCYPKCMEEFHTFI